MSKNELFRDLPENDALTLRLQGLGSKVKAPAALTTAAITGIPYRPRASAGIHVKRISKAIVAYAMSIVLLLGGLFFVTRLLDEMDDPAGTDPTDSLPPVVTTAPDETTAPPETEEPVRTATDGILDYRLLNNGTWGVYACKDATLSSVTVPAELEGIAVTELMDYCFYRLTALESVTLPDSVTVIGESAFSDCTSLTSVALPAKLTTIEPFAFAGSGLRQITIPGTVKTVDTAAFYGCASLQDVTLQSGIREIGMCSFENCTSLMSVSFPGSIEVVGERAFYACTALADSSLWGNIREIGSLAFAECHTMVRMSIYPEEANPPTVGYGAYMNCYSLSNVDGLLIEKFSEDMFKNCTSLTNIEINGWVKIIGKGAFENSGLMTADFRYEDGWSVKVPVNTVFAFDAADALRDSLSQVTWRYNGAQDYEVPAPSDALYRLLPDGTYCLFRCTDPSAERFEIPSRVTRIATGCFEGCTKLTNVTIPKTVTFIGKGAFGGCTALAKATFADPAGWNIPVDLSRPEDAAAGLADTFAHMDWTRSEAVDEHLIFTMLDDGTWAVSGHEEKTVTQVVVPAQYRGIPVTQILDKAFENCEQLTDVTISEGITAIGLYAFQHCGSLQEIHLPTTLKSIGAYAFSGCYALRQIELPSGLQTLGIHVFQYSNLQEAIIPDSVTSLGDGCFYNCSALRKVQISNGVTTIRSMTFQGCEALTEVDLPDFVGTIASDAFEDCSSLQSIILPASVCYIDYNAFGGCDRLTSVVFEEPNDWAILDYPSGEYVFFDSPRTDPADNAEQLRNPGLLDLWRRIRVDGDCWYYYVTGGVAFSYQGEDKTMTEYVIPDSFDGEPVTQLWGSFANCTNLERVTIPDTVTYIGYSVFKNCTALKEIALPAALENIEESAFEGSGLVSVTLPATLVDSYASTFKNCTDLETVIIEEGVTEICKEMFYGCTSLTEIVLPSTVSLIERDAFAGCINLKSVIFSDPNGWNVEQDLSNSQVAAKLLTETYIFLQWSKS